VGLFRVWVGASAVFASNHPDGSGGGAMHQLIEIYASWSGTLYVWGRTAVGILLWFWVVSGAIFVLRFLAFMLMDKSGDASALAAVSASTPYPIDSFKDESRLDSVQE
jgi:hypothetical protein